jgi:hypothetical protein
MLRNLERCASRSLPSADPHPHPSHPASRRRCARPYQPLYTQGMPRHVRGQTTGIPAAAVTVVKADISSTSMVGHSTLPSFHPSPLFAAPLPVTYVGDTDVQQGGREPTETWCPPPDVSVTRSALPLLTRQSFVDVSRVDPHHTLSIVHAYPAPQADRPSRIHTSIHPISRVRYTHNNSNARSAHRVRSIHSTITDPPRLALVHD